MLLRINGFGIGILFGKEDCCICVFLMDVVLVVLVVVVFFLFDIL